MGTPGFDRFIIDLFDLYNRPRRELTNNRHYVSAAAKRALGVLRNYTPSDDGETILLETAVEQFEELVRKAGGVP